MKMCVQLGALQRRPGVISESQWKLVQGMCGIESSKRVKIANVVEHLKAFAEKNRLNARKTLNPYREGMENGSLSSPGQGIDDFFSSVLETSIPEFLERLRGKSSTNPASCESTEHARTFSRLLHIFECLQAAQASPGDVAVNKFCDVLLSFNSFLGSVVVSEDSVKQRAMSQKVSMDNNVIHREIDELLQLLSLSVLKSVHHCRNRIVHESVARSDQFPRATAANVSSFLVDEAKQVTNQDRPVQLIHAKLRQNPLGENFQGAMESDDSSSEMIPGSSSSSSSRSWFIPVHELRYRRAGFIGEGSFGTVYHGHWIGTPVVVKFMGYEADDQCGGGNKLDMFMHELSVWYPLQHPNIVKLYGACDRGKRYFVCEYAPNGTLSAYLKKLDSRKRVWHNVCELALGLQYFHEMNIVHNDLKCDNALVGADGKAKLTDFGLSCTLGSVEVKVAVKTQGAKQWKAPEYLRGEKSTLASDVYSFGMLILEAVTGLPPWGHTIDAAVTFQFLKRGRLPLRPGADLMSDRQWGLIEMMCAAEPSRRLKISSVVDHLHEFARQSHQDMESPVAAAS